MTDSINYLLGIFYLIGLLRVLANITKGSNGTLLLRDRMGTPGLQTLPCGGVTIQLLHDTNCEAGFGVICGKFVFLAKVENFLGKN